MDAHVTANRVEEWLMSRFFYAQMKTEVTIMGEFIVLSAKLIGVFCAFGFAIFLAFFVSGMFIMALLRFARALYAFVYGAFFKQIVEDLGNQLKRLRR